VNNLGGGAGSSAKKKPLSPSSLKGKQREPCDGKTLMATAATFKSCRDSTCLKSESCSLTLWDREEEGFESLGRKVQGVRRSH